MAEAVLDGISYFTDGLCIPDNTLNGVSYFTNGLVIPAGFGNRGRGGMGGEGVVKAQRNARDRFIKRAQEEAEVIQTLIFLIHAIEDE